MVKIEDYGGGTTAWCPGCGNFGILEAVKRALVALEIRPFDALLCSGIGQAAKLPHYLKCNAFNGLHGRTLPVAFAAKMVNPGLTVFAIGGDGDMYGEGGNHLIHAIRRNPDITLLVHDNKIYGLTKGQASPTTDMGIKTKVQPRGVVNKPLNPLALAISQKCGFVARGWSGRIDHLAGLIQAGVTHRGFALIDILQPCVSFNKVNTHPWYKQKVYDVSEADSYDPADWHAALDRAYEWEDRIPIGILYQDSGSAAAEDEPPAVLVDHKTDVREVQNMIDSFL